MNLLKLESTDEALKEIIAEVDSDGNGHVSFDEFVKAMSALARVPLHSLLLR